MEPAIEYKSDIHSFLILNAEYDEIIEIPYILRDNDQNGNVFNEKIKNYGYKIFHKQNFQENDIFQIHESSIDRRIGWLMPISSIISKSHDFADNPHYCRYAFIAYQLLISYEISDEELYTKEFDTLINEKFIEDDAVIFIYDYTLTKDVGDFKVENYYASFYMYGYYLKSGYLNPYCLSSPQNGKIKIKRTSDIIVNKDYLDKYFNQLFIEENPFVKFHLLYQIIELLIEDILIYSLEYTIYKFKNKKIYTRSLREQISKVEAEKDRIILLSNWCNVASDKYSDLHNLCNTFLQNKGRDPIDFPQSLYAFRNFIVHDFRYMTEDKNIVSDVNYLFEQYILYLLLGYKHMDI